MGGHGLYSTCLGDYCRFIRMWLTMGRETGRCSRPKPSAPRWANGLGDMKIKRLPGVMPHAPIDAEFFPACQSHGATPS